MHSPLAQRMRPERLEDYVSQRGVVNVLSKFIENGVLPSMILWGPPGVGKTTLAMIVAESLGREFFTLSAVNSGVKDVREVLERARGSRLLSRGQSPVLFIDEIHRFNKSQQDSLLAAVEQGTIVLIGATTENPSFEVIRPLLSRCNVYTLNSIEGEDLLQLLHRAITQDVILKERDIEVIETDALLAFANGDARKLLNILDTLSSTTSGKITISNENVTTSLQQNIAQYDKGADQHYDTISAFIKSVRGSDTDAALYYLARMLNGGEEPRFIARRLLILAAEDIGLANNNALLLANATFEAVHNLGMPEARIPLAQCTIYLAQSPKGNSAYRAINEAMAFVQSDGYRPVPLHIRNAPTKLMKDEGYGVGYLYPHNYPNSQVEQQYMPDDIKDIKFYK
ncbi:MAG: replication-associated recombination protein A [Rikenellaceae bacterium]